MEMEMEMEMEMQQLVASMAIYIYGMVAG